MLPRFHLQPAGEQPALAGQCQHCAGGIQRQVGGEVELGKQTEDKTYEQALSAECRDELGPV